jgi:hypothetical protein
MANDFMANYGKLPSETRKWLNRAFFTPTYKVSMARVLGQMAKSPKRFRAQILRHEGYKLFFKHILPLIAGYVALDRFNKKGEVTTEGYRVVIKEKDKARELVLSFSDPLLEEAKFMQRKPAISAFFNSSFMVQAGITALNRAKGGTLDFPKSDMDRLNEYFKIGTPFLRDYMNWADEDKPTWQKAAQQMGVAYIYARDKFKTEHEERSMLYKLLDTFDLMPKWFENKETRELKNLQMAEQYYKSELRNALKDMDSDKLIRIQKETLDRYGVPILASEGMVSNLMNDILLRQVLTKSEYKKFKASDWVKFVLAKKKAKK